MALNFNGVCFHVELSSLVIIQKLVMHSSVLQDGDRRLSQRFASALHLTRLLSHIVCVVMGQLHSPKEH